MTFCTIYIFFIFVSTCKCGFLRCILKGYDMQKKTKYMNINYSIFDKNYIDYLIEHLGNISQEIVDFFDIREISVEVIMYDSLKKFQEKF